MTISADQQELVDLLLHELAEIIEWDLTALEGEDIATRVDLLEEFEMHAQNIGNAAELVGLDGLTMCCRQLAANFLVFTQPNSVIDGQQLRLLQTWPTLIIGYLQYLGDEEKSPIAAAALLDFVADEHWPSPLQEHDKTELASEFQQAEIRVEQNSTQYPVEVTDEMVSLEVAGDINPQLLRGLLLELPQQVNTLDKAVEHYLDSEDQEQLRIAQRIAHTLKGAANVVGIQGMANLMHYLEDLLELTEKKGIPEALGDTLQDAADCLANISEYLSGIGGKPTNLRDVLEAVLLMVRQLSGEDEESINLDSETDLDTLELEGGDEDIFDLVIADQPIKHSASPDDSFSATPSSQLEPSDQSNTITSQADQSIEVSADNPVANAEPIAAVSVERESNSIGLLKSADYQEEAASDASLDISENQAQELLRLTGEGQIANVQALSRIELIAASIGSAEEYHNQLRQMASDLERLLETQTALASATQAQLQSDDLDPLELERYNELNSFASQLREVTTDAHEAMVHIDDDLKFLKELVNGQRQIGFDVQDLVLQVRMLPVNIYSPRFQRCVRQTARLTDKPVELAIEGDEVLADNRIMSALVDPIMHLLRNAVDHGIEADLENRGKQGKPTKGQIKLSFSRVNDALVVHCRDDGNGLDYEAIERAARQRGFSPEGGKLSISDLHSLLLSAGFSTRSSVTQTSGRGVGLDVVNDQIRQLKGSLEIESEAGKGTCFTLTVPMSMLSAHTLVVQYGQFKLSVLSRALEQIVYLEPESLQQKDNEYFYQLAGEESLLPVVPLEKLVLLGSSVSPERYSALIVIRCRSGRRRGVMVEAIRASEEQIIKPLSKYTVRVPGVTGAAILGDGSVSPVVDLHELPGIDLASNEDHVWRDRFAKRLAHLQSMEEKEQPMVLVVDDSLSARRSLAQFVGDMGFEVYTAKDGFEAIQVVEQRRPTLILADLEMPRMNGLELTQHLKANEETADIPIIMITSRATEKHRQLAVRAGVNSYLNKPWTDEELMNSLQAQMAS